MSPILPGIVASGISGHLYDGPFGAFESLATVTVGAGGLATIDFVGIPSEYKHLQIRYTGAASNNVDTYLYFNTDTTAGNYKRHSMYTIGDGSVNSTADTGAYLDVGGIGTTYPVSGIVDILDYGITTKTKVARNFTGQDNNGSGRIAMNTILWNNTSAVTSIRITGRNFNQNSSFQLYGVK